ncbi:LysE family translocator [Sulfurospirillum arcachonense]|uniref:LysE family translocator n=1 Tax=Sulfurospirillum arcachonense TaxID=57666 RepID=UPI00046816E2|nr:LysE family translocator [Sulfurospirillum arcachonense]
MDFWTIDFQTLLIFITANAALNFSPGPAVLKVVGDSIGNGVGKAHASIAGVFVANFMYAILSILGIGTLILAFPWIFEFVKWIGVTYLFYLSIKTIKNAIYAKELKSKSQNKQSAKALFWTSFAMQGANPKSVLFFAAMLPVFAGEGAGVELRMITLAVLALILEYPALLLYSILGSKAAKLAVSKRSKAIMDIVAGSALGLAAFMVARTSLQKN